MRLLSLIVRLRILSTEADFPINRGTEQSAQPRSPRRPSPTPVPCGFQERLTGTEQSTAPEHQEVYGNISLVVKGFKPEVLRRLGSIEGKLSVMEERLSIVEGHMSSMGGVVSVGFGTVGELVKLVGEQLVLIRSVAGGS